MQSKSDVNNSLIYAVRSGMLERVSELIDCYGLSYCQEWSEGFALLCDAISYKKPEVAKLLLNKGSRVNREKVVEYNTKTYRVPISSPLHIAVTKNYIEISEMILDKGADMYDKDKDGKTPFYFAIHSKNIELIELFLKRGYGVNAKVTDDTSSIHEAAITRSLEIIEYFVNIGADVNSVSSKTGFAPLHFAAQSGNKNVTLFLLGRGAKVDLKGNNGMTPLHLASNDILDRTDSVIALLNNGAKVNAKSNSNSTPIHIAANRGNKTIVQVLLQHEANVDDQDEDNKTVLHHAILSKRIGIVKNILEYNPDINNENNRKCLLVALLGHTGRGPMSIKYYNIVAVLLDYGFNVNPEDAFNIKLLHGAVEKGCLEVVDKLLKYGADCHAREEYYGRTALHFTVLNQMHCASNENDQKELHNRDINLAKIAKLLINKGINVNCKTKAGKTTLHFASQHGYTEVVKVLLKHNANVNLRDNQGITPLYMVIEGCNEDVSIILLDNGADANVKTINNETPLHIAACRSNLHWSYLSSELSNALLTSSKRFREMTEAVLQFGADIDTKNADGKTALHIATEAGYYINNVQILLEYGSDINATSNSNLTPFESAIEKSSHNRGIDPKFYIKTCEVLIAHIVKMKAANVYISKNNLEKLSSSTRIRDCQNKCEEEIAIMKSDKINNTNVSIFDILVKSTSYLATYIIKNENIVQVLKSGVYKTKFPIYARTIECNIRKGMERKELLEQSDSILHFLLSNLPLPQECTEKIFGYLSNRDLKILLRGFNRFE